MSLSATGLNKSSFIAFDVRFNEFKTSFFFVRVIILFFTQKIKEKNKIEIENKILLNLNDDIAELQLSELQQ